LHVDKRDDQPNSITVNTANNQMNRTTTYVGPISLIHTHAFSTNTVLKFLVLTQPVNVARW